MSKKKEVVVITGATAGVGRASAREFARRGACIGLIARGTQGLEETKKELEELGAKALAISADVSVAEEIETAAQKVEGEFGPIDIWINDAMVTIYSPFSRMKPEEFQRVTDVTYMGFVYGTMAALKRMRKRDKGVIVQIGSALAYRSIPLQSAYCGAKHAIRGFTDSIRSELIHDKSNVKITAVHLPAQNTPQFDWGRNKMDFQGQPVPPIYQPEIAAKAIYYAAHNPKREIFVGISTWKAILGNKILPGFLDKYLADKAYSGQKTDQLNRHDKKDNLFSPVQGDFGAHGRFDSRAISFSPEVWLTTKGKSYLPFIVFLGLISSIAGFLYKGKLS